MINKTGECILCKDDLSIFKKKIYDTRFGIEGVFDIGMCNNCGLIQMKPHLASAELKNLYEKYYNFGGEKGTFYTKAREYFFTSVVSNIWMAVDGDIAFYTYRGNGRLLDFGCNEGRGLHIYKKNGYDAEGLEVNEVAAEQARRNGFTVYTKSLEDFNPDDLFDVVVLSNVLEHAVSPKEMLSNIRRILKPGGEVWISLPNANSWLCGMFGKYWINWHVPFHITHFSMDTLESILQESDFEIQDAHQETPALWVAHSLIVRLFATPGRATKQLRNPFLVASLLLLIRTFFFPILWLGNRLGRGDCIIIKAVSK